MENGQRIAQRVCAWSYFRPVRSIRAESRDGVFFLSSYSSSVVLLPLLPYYVSGQTMGANRNTQTKYSGWWAKQPGAQIL